MGSIKDEIQRDSKFLKLGDKDTFKGLYISFEKIMTKYGKGWRFQLEREDGNRIFFDTCSSKVALQFDALLDGGMKKGDPIMIQREGLEKETKYTITEGLPF